MGKTSCNIWTLHIQDAGLEVEGRLYGLLGPLGTLQVARLCNLFQNYWKSRCKASSICDNDRCHDLKGVRENFVWCPAHFPLKLTEFASNSYLAKMRPFALSVASLRHLTITCITKTKRHRIYAAQCGEIFANFLLFIYLRRMAIHNIETEVSDGDVVWNVGL
jgi:hypothetical protein